MSEPSISSTIRFKPSVYQALEEKAALAQVPISQLVDEAVQLMIAEDAEDLAACQERKDEATISYAALRADLQRHG